MTDQTMALTVPHGSGSLEAYVHSSHNISMLKPEQEYELAKRLQETGDLQAAKQLIMSHLRFVVHVAKGYSGYGLPQADLIQEGNIGLMKAVKRFDPDVGVRLVSFAVHWIKAEIHEYVLKTGASLKLQPRKHSVNYSSIFENLKSVLAGLAMKKWAWLLKILGYQKPMSLRWNHVWLPKIQHLILLAIMMMIKTFLLFII